MSKQRLNNLFFFLGLAAVVVMLFTFDVSFVELWEHICHAGYWLIPIVGVWIIIYGINALSWREIILSEIRRYGGTGGRVSFLRIYRLTITGYALNYATPVGGLGGEPYRILELSKNISGQQAASSVILYAMMHFFAHFWFWFSSIFIYLGLAAVGDLPINTAIATVLGIIILFCLIFFWIFSRGYRKGLVVSTLHLLGRIPGLKGWSSIARLSSNTCRVSSSRARCCSCSCSSVSTAEAASRASPSPTSTPSSSCRSPPSSPTSSASCPCNSVSRRAASSFPSPPLASLPPSASSSASSAASAKSSG